MNPTQASKATTVRVGLFTLFGLALIGAFTVFVNDKPYWWRKCEPVFINVEDATGLKPKSAIRSLGLQIGYLHSVELTETRVRIGVCITAPVSILSETRAYIRGEGFLGDKFVELKPVHYDGKNRVGSRAVPANPPEATPEPSPSAMSAVPPTGARSPSSRAKGAVGAKSATPEPSYESPLKALEQRKVEIEKDSDRPFPPSGQYDDVLPKDEKKAGIPIEPGQGAIDLRPILFRAFGALFEDAQAEDVSNAKEVQVGTSNRDMDKLIEQSNKLMIEMTDLTKNLKEGLHPAELRETIQQLNKTLSAASKTLSPEGSLNSTARRSLEKLEKAFDALQQQMERINRGEGSVGKLLNDPVYADEVLKAMKNLNKLLNKAADIQFIVRMGAEQLPAYDGGRGYFQLQVLPNPTRYYLLGITIDPRGSRTVTHTTTTQGTSQTQVSTEQIEEGKMLLTGMLGKILWNRFDIAAGALHGDGAVSLGLYLGPTGSENMINIKNDVYVRGQGIGLNDRLTLTVRPFARSDLFNTLYATGGIESFRKVGGKTAYLFGGGSTFSDDDIKLLFAFR
jgi:phospholipid/cholesterol/gamma-HCH transport system substrate-binding protein